MKRGPIPYGEDAAPGVKAADHVVIYAHVIRQALEDLGSPREEERRAALDWFTRERDEVETCCRLCGVRVTMVYEMVERIRSGTETPHQNRSPESLDAAPVYVSESTLP